MANETIKIGLQVDDGGSTQQRIKDANALKVAYDSAASSASKIGGTAGSRGVAAKAAPTGSQALMEDRTYNQLRGAAGVTGASARDFAAQSQGLGGLVRLYATFAANLFAVGAAYRALSNAADTSNLITGLNTLGAQSGKSLGTLSKRLVEVTDGAISLRDAMTAVAQSSSAGLSSKNIERLGQVAKNASLALGISVPDAISRLSRGITKLEPELLDELGLFTKLGPATDKYALSIGKTTAQLTDFEKRQAFALAVLDEGEQKFNSLAEAAANPYDKLLSSLKNVTQEGLSFLNKFVSPVVDLLSKSPTALVAVLAGIGSVLLKQAIPALGEFRAGLEKNAELAGKIAQGKAGAALAAKEQLGRLVEARVESAADDQIQAFAVAEAKLNRLAQSGAIRTSSKIRDILKKDLEYITSEDIAKAESSIKRLESMAKKDPSKKASAEAEREVLTVLKSTIASEQSLEATKDRIRTATEKNLLNQREYQKVMKATADYEKSAKEKAIISNVAYNSSILGMTNAWTLMKAEIEASGLKLTAFGKGVLFVRAGIASLIGFLGTLGSAVNTAFAVFATIAAVFSILDGILSKNTKETERFKSAIDAAGESVSNTARTLDSMSSKSGFTESNIKNTQALSNAFTELSDTATSAIQATRLLKEASSPWDNFWNSVFSVVGKDRDTLLANTVAKQIKSGFNILSQEGLSEEYASKLTSLLGVDSLADTDKVAAAFKNLSDVQKDELEKIVQDSNRKIGSIASNLQSFKDALDSTSKSYKEFLLSVADQNPLFKLGEQMEDLGMKMMAVTSDGIKSMMKGFDELAKNIDKIAFLGDAAKQVQALSAAFNEQKIALDKANSAFEQAKESVGNIKPQMRTVYVGGLSNTTEINAAETRAAREQANKELIRAADRVATAQKDALEAGGRLFGEIALAAFQKGSELAGKALLEAQQKGALLVQKAAAGALSGRERATAEGQLAVKELDIQLKNIDINQQLFTAQTQLVSELKLANALQTEANLIAKGEKEGSKAREDASQQVSFARAMTMLTSGGLNRQAMEGLNIPDDLKTKLEMEAKKAANKNAQFEASRILIKSQITSVGITQRRGEATGELEDEAKLQALRDRTNQALIAKRDLVESITGYASRDLLVEKISLANNELEAKQRKEVADLDAKIEDVTLSRVDALGAQATLYDNELIKLKAQKTQLQEAQRIEKDNSGLQNRLKLQAIDLEFIKRKSDLEASARDVVYSKQSNELDIIAAKNQAIVEMVGLDQQTSTILSNNVELRKAELTASKAIADANAAYNRERLIAERQIKTLGGPGADPVAEKLITDRLAEQAVYRDNAITKANDELSARTQILDITKKTAEEQLRYNNLLDSATQLSESLTGIFGDLGSKLGKVVETMSQVVIQNERNAEAQKKVNDQIAEIEASGDTAGADLYKKKYALDEKARKDELRGNMQILASTKNLFKEKTAGYKLVNAMEKAMFVESMVMNAQKTASMLVEGAKQIATLMSVITQQGISAVLNQGTGDPYTAIPRMAAMAAFVAALTGGRTAKPPTGFSAEQQQAVQGTGQAYDANGNIVNRAGGALGDPKAVAKSITSSVEILSREAFGKLGSKSSLLVKALEAIRDNTDQTAKALLGKVSGYAGSTASRFGTVEGTTGSYFNPTAALAGAGAGFKMGGFFGGPAFALAGSLIGMLGSKIKTTIMDAGIAVQGTLDDLSQGIGNFVNYENVKLKKSSLFGIISSTSYKQNIGDLEDPVKKPIIKAISNMRSGLLIAADALEGDATRAADLMKGIPIEIKTSLKGLTGKEAAEAISSELSVQLNAAAEKVFPYLEQYNKIGEEMFDTVSRIVSDSETLATGLSLLGKSIAKTDYQAQVATEQGIVELFGSIQKFIDSTQYYFDNFLNSQERYVTKFNSLNADFKAAGITMPKTIAMYKDLVTNTDATSESYAFLLTHAEEYNNLITLSNDLKSTEIKGYEDAISNLQNYAKSLKDFNSSLILGANSTLTVAEKYAVAKADFDTTRAAALTGDVVAIGKLQTTSQTLLDLSKQMYASSDQYTADFSAVASATQDAAAIAQTTADSTQLMLDTAKSQLSVLSSIDTNIAALTGGTTAFASGGYASGLSLVGERGPELVDFATPGRVYTAEQTAGMFAPSGNTNQTFTLMVSELRDLRQEVASLRKDQQKQTGDLIISNYDATQKLSDEVTSAVINSSDDVVWQDRSKPVIK